MRIGSLNSIERTDQTHSNPPHAVRIDSDRNSLTEYDSKGKREADLSISLWISDSTNTQGGGQETTALTFLTQLTHHGMIYVPIGYSDPSLFDMSEVHGGSPYGAGTFAGPTGARQPSALELGVEMQRTVLLRILPLPADVIAQRCCQTAQCRSHGQRRRDDRIQSAIRARTI